MRHLVYFQADRYGLSLQIKPSPHGNILCVLAILLYAWLTLPWEVVPPRQQPTVQRLDPDSGDGTSFTKCGAIQCRSFSKRECSPCEIPNRRICYGQSSLGYISASSLSTVSLL